MKKLFIFLFVFTSGLLYAQSNTYQPIAYDTLGNYTIKVRATKSVDTIPYCGGVINIVFAEFKVLSAFDSLIKGDKVTIQIVCPEFYTPIIKHKVYSFKIHKLSGKDKQPFYRLDEIVKTTK